MKHLRLLLQILLPLALLGGGFWLAKWLQSMQPAPVVEPHAFAAPTVRVHAVELAERRIDVETQGVVEPARAIALAAQVGGRVVAVSPALRAGGFFAEGEVLVEIDPADFALAIVQQEAAVARAELRVLQEQAEADAARRAWQELEGRAPGDPLVRREPQIADAEKALAAARALLDKARLDLERTKVKAPFAGRVRSASVDTGQIAQPGAPLAQLYGTEHAEVRLPLPARDAAFLDLPLHWSDAGSPAAGPAVDLVAAFGGREHVYRGSIVRTEGEVDRRTRQLTAVARIEAPYARNGQQDRPPLAVGTFVRATIHGRSHDGVAALPREALAGQGEVWVVDAGSKLHRRTVDVLREVRDLVYVRGNLAAGELVCTTRLEAPVENMPVRRYAEPPR
ncbi:MAG: efflux RND transporter periplasmic adaptor subunit [Planctomycetes bacterium]|nr:efflux RND transporter periplasmic adaptor subunit [Planctomycetota bacterium]